MLGFFSFLIALSIGLVFVFSGVLLKALGSSGKSRNPVAGYRTSRSMKSPESWIAANRHAAKYFTATGVVIILSGLLLWWKPLPQFYNEVVIIGIMFAGIATSLVATESYLKRNFNRDGSPKTGQSVNDKTPFPRVSPKAKETRRIPFSQLDYLLEVISLAVNILGIFLLIYSWPQLPEQVPRHFNFQGMVDGWGTKQTALVFPILNILIYLSLSLIRFFAPALYPARDSTSQRILRLSIDLIAWLKAWTACFFTCFFWGTIEIALGRLDALSSLFLPLALVVNLAIIVIYTSLILREVR